MYQIDAYQVLFDSVIIYEAPGRVLDYILYNEDLILVYDVKDVFDNYEKAIGLEIRNHNVLRVSSSGKEIWKISDCEKAYGFWAIYIKNKKFYAAGFDDRKHIFDPETGKTLGWGYPSENN